MVESTEQIVKLESERIINLANYESLIFEARKDTIGLKNALKRKDIDTSSHIVEQLDLKLHELEAYEFEIERRMITVNNHCEHQ